MAKSIVISLGWGLRHLGHFGYFDCLLHFNFFNHSGGVSGLRDGFSDGSSNNKSDDNGCKQCGSEGEIIDCGLTSKPSILIFNSTSNW